MRHTDGDRPGRIVDRYDNGTGIVAHRFAFTGRPGAPAFARAIDEMRFREAGFIVRGAGCRQRHIAPARCIGERRRQRAERRVEEGERRFAAIVPGAAFRIPVDHGAEGAGVHVHRELVLRFAAHAEDGGLRSVDGKLDERRGHNLAHRRRAEASIARGGRVADAVAGPLRPGRAQPKPEGVLRDEEFMVFGARDGGRGAGRCGRIRHAGDVAHGDRMDHRLEHALHRHPDILGAEQRAAAQVFALALGPFLAPLADLRRIERIPPAAT